MHMRQSLIRYTIKDGVALQYAVGALLHSGFKFVRRQGPDALWAETLEIRVREGTADEEAVIDLISRYAPGADLRSRGDFTEAIEGYRDGHP